MSKLSDDVAKKLKETKESIQFLTDHIVEVDADKEIYDSGIAKIDRDLVSQLNIVNQTIGDVATAYDARITVGCRTDMFWRVKSQDSASIPATTTLVATKISLNGYDNIASSATGIGTVLAIVNTSGGITTMPASSAYVGVQTDFLYGLKYFDQPITKDIGDTTVGNFIGTVGTGSTVLTIMTPYSNNLWLDFKVGMLVSSDKDGVFSANSTNTIVGFSSAITDLSGITTNPTQFTSQSGIGITVAPIILLEDSTVGFATAPESDGEFVTFNVLDDPTGITTYTDYAVPFDSNPFSPESIGIVKESNIGIGVSVIFDNSGISSNPKSWKPEFAIEGYSDDGIPDVKAPPVGAGRVYYKTAFSNRPISGGSPAEEGDEITVNTSALSSGLYESLPSCSAEDAAVTAAESTRDTTESNFYSNLSTFNKTVDAANALRIEREKNFNGRIYGARQGVGELAREQERYETLDAYFEQESL